MRKIIALFDSDSIYAARFLEYFQNKQDFEWEVVAFTKKEKLADYLHEHKIELFLIGPEEVTEVIPTEYLKFCYQLTQERSESNPEQNRIYRYQSVERIMEQILADYMRKQDEVSLSMNPNRMNISTVYSVVPGSQDIAFAWSFSFQLAKQRKALFLPLELLSFKQIDFTDHTKHGLSEFIYYLKENSNTPQRWKELLNYNNNLAYLTGVNHGFDLLSLNKEDMQRWIELLRTGTDYQNVVFYLGFYQEAGAELLRLSDRVVILRGQSPYEEALCRDWERQMDCVGIDPQKPKFKSIIRSWDPSGAVIYRNLQELIDSPVWQQAQDYLKEV